MIDKGIKTGLYTGARYFGEARLLQAMQGSCGSEPARESFCLKLQGAWNAVFAGKPAKGS